MCVCRTVTVDFLPCVMQRAVKNKNVNLVINETNYTGN